MTALLPIAAGLLIGSACLPPGSDRITAGDIAGVVPAFAKLPAELVLSYAPAPGVTRVFAPAELQATLVRHDLEAAAVEPVCFEWPMRHLTSEDVRAAMVRTLGPDAQVSVVSFTQGAVAQGEIAFDRRPPAGASVWKGRIEYTKGRYVEVWAKADVRVPYTRLTATAMIRPGDKLTGENLRIETGFGPLAAEDALRDVSEASGRTVRRLIPAGATIVASALDKFRAVSKGDLLQVDVVSGRARLRFGAAAQAAGSVGDLIPVRNIDTGKLLQARVESQGRAVLDLGGRQAE